VLRECRKPFVTARNRLATRRTAPGSRGLADHGSRDAIRTPGCRSAAGSGAVSAWPWDRKLYWIADGTGNRTGLRPTDSIQLLLRATDAVAGPGAVARVDG
jgi:hypothetical protein